MSSPSGKNPGSTPGQADALSKALVKGSTAGAPSSTTTSMSAMSMKVNRDSLKIKANQNGQKSSFQASANKVKTTSGDAQVSFDFSKGKLSLKSGDTHFSLEKGKAGLNMSATDLKSKTTSSIDINKSGKVTRTDQSPTSFKKSVSQDPHMGKLAGMHADRIGNMKSPMKAFGDHIFGAADAKKSGSLELGFSAFARHSSTSDAKGTRSTTETGMFMQAKRSKGKGKARQTRSEAFGVATSTSTEHGADGDIKAMEQRRRSVHTSTHKGRKD